MNKAILKEILLQDFIRYLKWSFKTKYKKKIILKQFHLDICNALIKVYNGEIKNLIINIPPRGGKTEILNTFFEWTLTKHPNAQNIITSYSDTLALRNSQSVRDMFTNNEHKELFNIEINKDSTAKKYWKTKENGGLYAVSSFGQITGFGAGLKGDEWGGCIGIDDPLKPDDRNSLSKLEKIKDWYQTTLSNRKNSPKTPIIIIMQRLHSNDLVGNILDNHFNNLEDWEVCKIETFNEEEKLSIWEEQYPYEAYQKVKNANPSYYYSQFQQQPIIQGGNLFKRNWTKYINSDVINSIKFEKYFITVDSALKSKEHNDYTVYSAFGVAENKLYLLDMYRGKPESKERELTLKAFYNRNNKYPFGGCYIEQKASGIDLFQRLRSDGFIVKEVERNTDKLLRANNTMPYLETHNLHIYENLPHLNELLSEFEQFPNSKHDDIIDTIIDGVELCYMKANINLEEFAQRHKEFLSRW